MAAQTSPDSVDVLIVGAGITGIGMAAHLTRECPGKSFRILERRDALGGTWDLFRYPGVRSDSDMYTLGYGFAPWRQSESIAGGDAIRDYLASVAQERGIVERISFGRRVTAADWSSTEGLWRVTVEDANGAVSHQSARFLFIASGYYDYDTPHDPRIPGLSEFGGEVLHPQFWPADFDPTGKRVVVIGSGATAATLVPALAGKAASVTMLQRTPSWFFSVPARDHVALIAHKLLPLRLAHSLIRLKNVLVQTFFFNRSRAKPDKVARFLSEELQRRLGDNYRAEDFTPPYGPWQQRMCFVPDGDFLEAINRGEAQVVTGHIARVERDCVALEDGRRIEADAIVTATGLNVVLFGKIALSLDGAPVNIAHHFYYRSCLFSNIPNLAAPFGYLNAGWTLRVEIVAQWLCRLFNQMDAWNADVVTPVLPDDHGLTEEHPLDAFSSSYLQRARDAVPRSATSAPWRIGMDYLSDRVEMRDAPIDDGVLAFRRVREREPAQ